MTYGLRAVMTSRVAELGGPDIPEGAWLASFDPELHDGVGGATWTLDQAEAMQFVDSAAAMACWMTQSTTVPTRPDGRPNRPLSAFSITCERIPDQQHQPEEEPKP